MSRLFLPVALVLLLVLVWSVVLELSSFGHAAIYQVGPDRAHQTLQDVAGLLNPGDLVEVDGDTTYPLPAPLKLPPMGAVEGVNAALDRVIYGNIDIGAFEHTPPSSVTATALAGPGGSVSPGLVTVPLGNGATFTITPEPNWVHGNISGTCPAGALSANTYTTGPLDASCTLSFNFLNPQATGGIHAHIEPQAARTAGARWRRAGTSVWLAGGSVETDVPPGTYDIEFDAAQGWIHPARPTITVAAGLPTAVTGHYARQRAGVLHVDDSNTTGTESGTAQYPYADIQTAVSHAASDDVIKVAVGVYGHVNTQNKALTILGGYPGAGAAQYAAGQGGDFSQRDLHPESTVISGGPDNDGFTFTRNSDAEYHGVLNNLTVRQSRKGIVCDTEASWPHPDNLTITNVLVEHNGREDEPEMYSGAGIILSGGRHQIMDSIIRDNRGGWGAGILSRGGDDSTLLLARNRIENNICSVDSCHGAGLTLFSGTKTITGNHIIGNRIDYGYGWGGGVFTTGAGATYMSGNVIRGNHAPTYGGAVFVDGATAHMTSDLIHGNSSGEYGGAGIAVDKEDQAPSHVYLTNCTIAQNTSTGTLNGGNGLYLDSGSTATVINSIFWNNGDDFYVRPDEESALSMTWSLSQEVWPGIGNQHGDPLFADPVNEDFHLRSTVGRYHPASGHWVADIQHSPAIDAGNPTSIFTLEPRPNGRRVNLGAYGNTAQSSLSDLGGGGAVLPGVLLLLLE